MNERVSGSLSGRFILVDFNGSRKVMLAIEMPSKIMSAHPKKVECSIPMRNF